MSTKRDPGSAAARARPLEEAPDYESLARFRFAIRQFLSYSDSVANAVGITSQQYQVMLCIKVRQRAEASLKQIAEDMLLLPHGAVQLVNRLETMKLVRRRKSAVDGRMVLVSLTSKGRDILSRLAKDHAVELGRHEPLLADCLQQLRGMPVSGSAPAETLSLT
ncbi:hypothetical protein ASD04_06950 [Devosia sp. Root436]|jgi:DNA-binding MarR family transcriptional regulator|uniref:MarR family winged helix-turn-helix transcriptional regulator n=1 Tax=Devosia sp. Root436 TaxID=1736537 RepID=UPI0006FE9926|nr:MarR family transcriptional regulator [Devosia sp. Root436]KQX40360.1 hypothetical protein ASD04_06950 [Devosia sp. Root436]